MRNQGVDIKSCVIAALSKDFPLSVGALQEKIFLAAQRKVTKQAIHKATKQLLSRGVLRKSGSSYLLSPEYIEQLERELANIKSHYFSKTAQTFDLPVNATRKFTSNSLLQNDSLWNSIITEKMLTYKRKRYPYLQMVPHAWFALSHFEAEIKVTSTITELCSAFYTLVNGSSALDQWIRRFYEGENSHYACRERSRKDRLDFQVAVIGDYILESKYPPEISERLAYVFDYAQNLSQLNLQELISLVNAPCSIELILRRQRSRAEKLSEEILGNF